MLAITGEVRLMVHWFKKMGAMVAKIIRMTKEKKLVKVGVCLKAE